MDDLPTPVTSRRTALKVVGSVGIGASLAGCLTGNGNGSGSDTLRVGTTYGADDPVPLAQNEFMDNLDAELDGEIDTELYPGGQLGTQTEIASMLQGDSAEVGSLSYSNLAPYVEEIDLINLPYFAGDYQSFLNLITSGTWEDHVHDALRENGFEPLYTWMSAPRSLGVVGDDPVLVPEDVEGLDIRIADSEIAQLGWDLAGANAVPVAWDETAQALEEGVVDGLHVSPQPINAFGIQDSIDHATIINKVMDVGIFIGNRDWLQDQPDDVEQAVYTAAENTFLEQLDQIEETFDVARDAFDEAGVEMHELDDDQLQEWEEQAGYQNEEWDDWKADLAGDMETFEEFEAATEEESEYDAPEI